MHLWSRFIGKLRLPPSKRKTAEYLEFDRAVKAKDADAISRGVILLKRFPSDKLVRKRTGAVAYKVGQRGLASEILLGGLSEKKRAAIHRALVEISSQFIHSYPKNWYEIVPGGTQATCLAVFHKGEEYTNESAPLSAIAIAKVLSRFHRGHRKEIKFYKTVKAAGEILHQLPEIVEIKECGIGSVIIAMECVVGRVALLQDAQSVRVSLKELREQGRKIFQGSSFRSRVNVVPDISYVVAVYVLRSTCSLRYLVRWLHLQSVCFLLRQMIKNSSKSVRAQWETDFVKMAGELLSSRSMCRQIFPANCGDLVHGDLNKGNILIADSTAARGANRRCVFIDWENWHYGFSEYDFARFFEGAKPDIVLEFESSIDDKPNLLPQSEAFVRRARFIFLWLTAEFFRWDRKGHSATEEEGYRSLIRRLENITARIADPLCVNFQSNSS